MTGCSCCVAVDQADVDQADRRAFSAAMAVSFLRTFWRFLRVSTNNLWVSSGHLPRASCSSRSRRTLSSGGRTTSPDLTDRLPVRECVSNSWPENSFWATTLMISLAESRPRWATDASRVARSSRGSTASRTSCRP